MNKIDTINVSLVDQERMLLYENAIKNTNDNKESRHIINNVSSRGAASKAGSHSEPLQNICDWRNPGTIVMAETRIIKSIIIFLVITAFASSLKTAKQQTYNPTNNIVLYINASSPIYESPPR